MKKPEQSTSQTLPLRFLEQFADDKKVKIPLVYAELTTSKVLVVEFVRGISFEEVLKKKLSVKDRKEIAINGYEMVIKQVLDYGFFHADPHLGNLMLLPDNVICILDFGMY